MPYDSPQFHLRCKRHCVYVKVYIVRGLFLFADIWFACNLMLDDLPFLKIYIINTKLLSLLFLHFFYMFPSFFITHVKIEIFLSFLFNKPCCSRRKIFPRENSTLEKILTVFHYLLFIMFCQQSRDSCAFVGKH